MQRAGFEAHLIAISELSPPAGVELELTALYTAVDVLGDSCPHSCRCAQWQLSPSDTCTCSVTAVPTAVDVLSDSCPTAVDVLSDSCAHCCRRAQ